MNRPISPMRSRTLILLLLLTLLGSALLHLRHRHALLWRRAAAAHARLDAARHELWHEQARLNARLEIPSLRRRLEQGPLEWEPALENQPAPPAALVHAP